MHIKGTAEHLISMTNCSRFKDDQIILWFDYSMHLLIYCLKHIMSYIIICIMIESVLNNITLLSTNGVYSH